MFMPFERSIRVLRDDRTVAAVLGFVLTAALLVAWAAWLTLARIHVRAAAETGRVEIVVEGSVRVVAHYRAGAPHDRIAQAAGARVRVDGSAWIDALVVAAVPEPHGGLRVELELSATRIRIAPGAVADVEIEVDTVSPLELLLSRMDGDD